MIDSKIDSAVQDWFENRYQPRMQAEGRFDLVLALVVGDRVIEVSTPDGALAGMIDAGLRQSGGFPGGRIPEHHVRTVMAQWFAQVIAGTAPDAAVIASGHLAARDPRRFNRMQGAGEVRDLSELPIADQRQTCTYAIHYRHQPEVVLQHVEEALRDDDGVAYAFQRRSHEGIEAHMAQGAFVELFALQSGRRPPSLTLEAVDQHAARTAADIVEALSAPTTQEPGL